MWEASIWLDKKLQFLGYYATKEQAAYVYDLAAFNLKQQELDYISYARLVRVRLCSSCPYKGSLGEYSKNIEPEFLRIGKIASPWQDTL